MPNFRSTSWVLLAFVVAMVMPDQAHAQLLSVDLGQGGGSATARIFQLILIITVLSLAPSILIMMTSFTRIIVVLSFLRSALGLQQSPPNMVLVSLALFLTLFIMMPTFQAAYDQGMKPLMNEEVQASEALIRMEKPFHSFMGAHVREKDVQLFMDIANKKPVKRMEDVPFQVMVPAFMISELRRAFEIGFMIFIPFLIIDMLVASTLMAMGMMMLPPVVISLPFKLIFFVIIDGWHMIAASLVKSFG